MVAAAHRETATEAVTGAAVEFASPVLDFFEKAILIMNGDNSLALPRKIEKSVRDAWRAQPRFFDHNVEICRERRFNHRSHMRAWRHAKPRDSCTACSQGAGDARLIRGVILS